MAINIRLTPDLPESREAIRKFEQAFSYAAEHYFAENKGR